MLICVMLVTRRNLLLYYAAEGADEIVFLDISATVEERQTMVEVRQTAGNFCSSGSRRRYCNINDINNLLRPGQTRFQLILLPSGIRN